MSDGYIWLAPLEPDQQWTGVSGCVLACLDGHRFGAWATDEGAACPDCGGVLRIEESDDCSLEDARLDEPDAEAVSLDDPASVQRARGGDDPDVRDDTTKEDLVFPHDNIISDESSEPRWYVVDHDRDDAVLRGPYDDASTAGAVRREMERGEQYDEANLWIILRIEESDD